MYLEKLTIIIWVWIPVINVERYIDFTYVNMKVLIYILEFKHLRNYSVTMVLNIVSSKWLYRRGSNSKHLSFKSHCLRNMSLGNLYRSNTKQSRIHFHVYIESLFSWHFGRTQQSTQFASQRIDGDENSENEDHYIVRLQPGFMNTDEPDEYDSLTREWSREFCNNVMADD